ncbi:MAG: amylo-alpha-1,6-glucosidase [Deltaproteobacteria bacterium]|nr:amylo-alpha-1,6-glucosidase [Deltaproteobacteria bacterium]
MVTRIGKEVCVNLNKALTLEWLETNGIGGYASSTILSCHTRKYHGMLVARLADPPGKYVLYSKHEDALLVDNQEFFLSAHEYPGVVFPRGHQYLTEFRLDDHPEFLYRVGAARVRREIRLVHGENTVLFRYVAQDTAPGTKLRIKPLLAYRDFHALSKRNISLQVRTFPCREGFLISPYHGMPTLYVQVEGAPYEFFAAPDWYRDFEYHKERLRGFEFQEDLFTPGMFEIDFEDGADVILSASLAELPAGLKRRWDAEAKRRAAIKARIEESGLRNALAKSALSFVTEGDDGRKAITAGYPWFLEWGRDAMISLPGLTLRSGEERTCLEVLETFARHERDGLIPNFLGAARAENAYNSVDASLWFAWAVQKYLEHTGDHAAVRKRLWPTLERIFTRFREGTHHGIGMLANGLLAAGSPAEQVTWMDATADGRPVTARHGCPVEVNALWFNLVSFVAELGARYGASVAPEAAALAPRIAKAFYSAFWLEDEGRLADVWREGEVDTSMRPNQVVAASLPYSPLKPAEARSMLEQVRRRLLTPAGLRTLAPDEPAYRGRYEGPPSERDRAYHNGTAWPWLLGPYGEALLKTATDKAAAVAHLEGILNGFEAHLGEVGLGSISEVFDGDPPHYPHGCPQQAWSVAEILRLARLVAEAKAAPKPKQLKAAPRPKQLKAAPKPKQLKAAPKPKQLKAAPKKKEARTSKAPGKKGGKK